MSNRWMLGRVLLGALCVALPISVQAGFGFGFDSDNGFYDYDPEDYPWWGGYPPPGYRDYNPAWRWGSERDTSGWRRESKRPGSGWRWGSADRNSHTKKRDRDSSTWWHSRKLKDDDGWSSWGREWSFGRDNGEPVKLNFGSFDWGDRWSPSFGKKSWSFGHKPRRYPGWGYPPPAPYPAWGAPYAPPVWGANPYGAVAPYYTPPTGAAVSSPAPTSASASNSSSTAKAAGASSGEAGSPSATPADNGSSAQAQETKPKGADAESH